MTITLNVDIDSLIHGLSKSEFRALVLSADLKFAEVDFTLDLLKDLFQSLQSDMTKEEILAELA